MRLSGLALRILLDDDPQSAERRAALREAALGPRIHAELWERYGIDLPSDQSLKRFLVLERNFNEASVDELLAEYKGTMTFAGLAARGWRPVGSGEQRGSDPASAGAAPARRDPPCGDRLPLRPYRRSVERSRAPWPCPCRPAPWGHHRLPRNAPCLSSPAYHRDSRARSFRRTRRRSVHRR